MPADAPIARTFRTRPVTGSTRATAPPGSPTQTLPAPTATPADETPRGKERETRLVRGSTKSSCPLSELATQIPPSPAARPAGEAPNGMVASTPPLTGSILDSVASVALATHTDR